MTGSPGVEPPGGADGALEQWLERAWRTPARVGRVDVEGCAISYRLWAGPGESAPGLMLVHGLGAHASWWDHVAPHLARHFRVVAIDMSGFGESEGRENYALAQYAREVLAVSEHELGPDATIIGHSLGGIISLIACRMKASRFRRAIIIDSRVYDPASGKLPIPRGERIYPDKQTILSRYRLIPPGRWPHPRVFEYIAERSIREVSGGWTWRADFKVAEAMQQPIDRDWLAEVEVPLHFIHGEESEIVTRETAITFAKLFETTVGLPLTIPAAHHHIMIEQPLAMTVALQALLLSHGVPDSVGR